MSVLTSILEVFMAVAEWIGSAILALIPIFWSAETGLTFIGVLSVASLAFAIIFLVIHTITKFIQFRAR